MNDKIIVSQLMSDLETPKDEIYDEQGHLIGLDLSGSGITQLPREIGKLANLQSLYLYNNRLTQVPVELGQLAKLEVLYLGNNQLTQVPVELGQLANLRWLDLSNNRLTQVPRELGQLANLQHVSLVGNPHLLTPPPEIVAKGTRAILAFLRELLRGSVDRYEAKLLLVGEGGTGKSSLLRALQGRTFDAHLDTTHGIELNRLSLPHPRLPEQPLTLNTWDFGGQDIYHATHQFFLTKRSLYLVAWNARLGAIQGKLDYWLDTIRVLAPDAPVLLVATHIDERAPDLNVQQYRAAYPQIVDVLYVSSKTGERIEKVKETLAQHASALPLVGQPWPLSWVKVEQALLARPEHHIDDRMYFGLCKSKKVQAEMAQGRWAGICMTWGRCFTFAMIPS